MEHFDRTKKQWLKKDFIKSSYFKVTLIVLIFFSLGFLIYSNTLENPFVFDDTSKNFR